MLIILNTIANRSKIIATGIDGAAVTLVSAQYTNYLIRVSITQIFRKVNVSQISLYKNEFMQKNILGMGLKILIIPSSTNGQLKKKKAFPLFQ